MEIQELKKRYESFMPEERRIPVEELEKIGFFTNPAGRVHHGTKEGDLFIHSLAVAEVLVEITEKLELKWERPESPYIVGMYHDLCKSDDYKKDPDGEGFIWNKESILPGHGDKSLIMIQKYITLTDEEIACIRWHMGAYEKDTRMWEYYGRAVTKYPNVLYTHTADMIASKVVGI